MGELLELVAPDSAAGELVLLLWTLNRAQLTRQVKFDDRVYVPTKLDPVMSRAIRFAPGVRNHGSLRALFQRMTQAIRLRSDLAENDIKKVAYWSLASWFPDILTVPSLSVTSVSPVLASCFLGLLRCFSRRGLRLAELNPGSLCTIPMHIQPTLLVDQTTITRRLSGILRASCRRDQYVPASGGCGTFTVPRPFSARARSWSHPGARGRSPSR
jgi:hypothetical protein